MPTYRINEDGVARARELIDAGKVDVDTEWADAAPSADDENAEIEKHGYDGYGAWHLAVDAEANEETKKRYAFPYGDWPAAGSRREPASGGGQRVLLHAEIEQVADDLLQHLDATRRG
ncbi:hypothetical protein [Blastococcus mobilis]|uniref:Uncharacterized protein n=1 Tax=Blastococcus mobilis TaxID=1938746 RepID=A0A238WWV5_9ACTN|nr:hypothetical protein [Blastococcus mobilis]SNR50948.1 hypothetical protein SAMN06272737_11078 [Blastococcus mobilis]